jgi:hypothetical protein
MNKLNLILAGILVLVVAILGITASRGANGTDTKVFFEGRE